MIKLYVGVCTYNRKDIIEYSSKSLNEIRGIENCKIHVFDDCSTEYDKKFLQKIYNTKNVVVNKNNIKADNNTEQMYRSFLKSNCDYLLNADSDLIYNRDLIKIIEKIIKKFKKINQPVIFSLFNTENHEIVEEYDSELCIKKDLGAAGMVFSKEAVKIILDNIDKEEKKRIGIDFSFSKIFNDMNYKLFCTKKSYVQHIGIEGQNSKMLEFDWGKSFEVDSLANAQAINYIFDNYYMANNKKQKARLLEQAKNNEIGVKTALKIFIYSILAKLKR